MALEALANIHASTSQDTVETLVIEALGPFLARDLESPDRCAGRTYEYIGPRDPLGDEADRATEVLEGLALRDALPIAAADAVERITTGWIANRVDAAILQSAPERQVAELTSEGNDHPPKPLIHPPPAPVAKVRVPALTFGPLRDAVDASGRRLAEDPAQQELRARALLTFDGMGRACNRVLARDLAAEVSERLDLERTGLPDEKAQRRHAELAREEARRQRYAKAFAVAASMLTRSATRIDSNRLFRAFEAVAGLDKAPFRRGPSEHLTPPLLATMAVEFYRALQDPDSPASFLMLTFPIKNSSGLRTNTATEAADFGELLMLAQLRRMLQFLAALGLPNVRFICLTDGIVYSRYLGPYDRIQAAYYRENVRQFRNALGLQGRVLIVDAEHLLRRIPAFDRLLARVRAALDHAETESAVVRSKLLSLTRSFLFHVHARGEDPSLLARIVDASLRGRELDTPAERAEQCRIWEKAAADARWYAAHLLLMSALDVVRNLVATPFIRATVHPKPGQFAPAPVNVRDFTDLPYHRKPLLRAGANPLNIDTYLGVNLWADPSLRFVDVYVGANRSPFLGVKV